MTTSAYRTVGVTFELGGRVHSGACVTETKSRVVTLHLTLGEPGHPTVWRQSSSFLSPTSDTKLSAGLHRSPLRGFAHVGRTAAERASTQSDYWNATVTSRKQANNGYVAMSLTEYGVRESREDHEALSACALQVTPLLDLLSIPHEEGCDNPATKAAVRSGTSSAVSWRGLRHLKSQGRNYL